MNEAIENILTANTKTKFAYKAFMENLRALYRERALEYLKLYLQENVVLPKEFSSIEEIDEPDQAGYKLILEVNNPAGDLEEIEFNFFYAFEGVIRQMKITWYGDCYSREEWFKKENEL